MENFLADRIKAEQEKYATELDGLRREKDKLERKRKKLLEAHYNDAIPLDLMKSEQQKIAKQLAAVESQIKAHEHTSAIMLNCLLDLIEDCGKTYRLASDHIKRMMNQAIFSKLWIESDGRVTAEFREPFKTVVEPISTLVAQFNQQKIRGAEALTDFLSVISNRIQKFFGCGWSNDLLVRLKGLEPTRVSAREPKSRMSTNSITGAYGRRDVPAAIFVQLTTPGWQNSRPASLPGASAPPIRPPAAAAPPSAACRCSYSPWKIRGPRCRE